MRTYGEVIDVRTATGPSEDRPVDATGAPAQFLWRGRLYLVRDVLAHWVEIGAWWSHPRRTGGTTRRPVPAPVPAGTDLGGRPDPDRPAPPRSVALDVGAVEREVWRVEAAAGRSATCGVYDLVRDVPAHDPSIAGTAHAVPPRWRLARTCLLYTS